MHNFPKTEESAARVSLYLCKGTGRPETAYVLAAEVGSDRAKAGLGRRWYERQSRFH